MRIKFFSRIFAAVLLITIGVITASAQVTTVNGKVTLKQADGTEVPVKDAVIDIYRTDISGKYQTKTNSKGEYVHAGIPFGGTYTMAVSAPGAKPTFLTGLKLSQQGTNNFTLEPGDGSKLTLDQIKQASAGGAGGGGGSATGAKASASSGAPSGESKEDKAKREEFEKEKAKIEEQNKKVAAANEIVNRTFKAGNEAFQAKQWDTAITSYDEGIQADPEQPVLYLNKSIAMRMRGVDKFNNAVKNKDAAGRDAAKTDFVQSAETAEKAVELYKTVGQARAQANAQASSGAGAGQASNELLNYLAARSETYRIALQTGSAIPADKAVAAIQEYVAAETDPAKKSRAEASLGEALFQSGKVDEAIDNYKKILATNPENLDAMYGLGLALAAKVTDASKDAAIITEARETLQKFISKAPDTHPKKQEAVASAQYLEETAKGAAASKDAAKPGDTRGRQPARRKN